MTGPRRSISRLGFAAAGLLGLIVASELALRAVWIDDPRPPAPEIPPGDWTVFTTLAELGRGNQQGIFKGAYFRTNSHGFRGPDITRERPPGVARIVVAGDSVAMGAGVDEAATFARLTQDRLNADGDWPAVEVVNSAIGGADISIAMIRLQSALALYGADVTVYAFSLDDIRGPAFRVVRPSGESQADLFRAHRLEQRRSLLVRTLEPWIDRLRSRGASDDWMFNYFENPEAWAYFSAGLSTFELLNRSYGSCGVVLIQPRLLDLGPTHPYRPIYHLIASESRMRGLAVVDGFAAHAWHRAEPLWFLPGDPHPNAAGHAILADALIEGLLALPDSCWPLRPGVPRSE